MWNLLYVRKIDYKNTTIIKTNRVGTSSRSNLKASTIHSESDKKVSRSNLGFCLKHFKGAV